MNGLAHLAPSPMGACGVVLNWPAQPASSVLTAIPAPTLPLVASVPATICFGSLLLPGGIIDCVGCSSTRALATVGAPATGAARVSDVALP